MALVPASSRGGGLPLTGGTLTGPLVIAPTNPAAVALKIQPADGATVAGTNSIEAHYDNTVAQQIELAADAGGGLDVGGSALAGVVQVLRIGAGGFAAVRDNTGAFVFMAIAGGGVRTRISSAAGALSTTTFVSGTAKQIDTNADRELVVPVTYNPTAGAAATCKVELSPDNVTFSTLGTETEPAGVAFDGTIHLLRLLVPSSWYVKLTVTNATLGTGTYY